MWAKAATRSVSFRHCGLNGTANTGIQCDATGEAMKGNAAVNQALRDPDLLKRFADLGSSPLGGTPQQLAERVDFEMKR